MAQEINVLITGGAGRIAYSLIPFILNGSILGEHSYINIRLFDIPESNERLQGIKMEIDDSNFSHIKSIIATVNVEEAFKNVDIAIILGGYPRLPGMERRDLLIKNAESIRAQALALNQYGSSNTKVIVIANPANTNCLVAIRTAPNIPAKNFTCLTRLDEERLRTFCAKKISQDVKQSILSQDVSKVFILGNHSTTQVAYIDRGRYLFNSSSSTDVAKHFNNEEYATLLSSVQNRGASIIKHLQMSSAMSAAEAISKHLRDWLGPEIPSEPFSMGVISDENPYKIPEGLVFSFPCYRTSTGEVKIFEGLSFNSQTQQLIDATIHELESEKSQIQDYLVSK